CPGTLARNRAQRAAPRAEPPPAYRGATNPRKAASNQRRDRRAQTGLLMTHDELEGVLAGVARALRPELAKLQGQITALEAKNSRLEAAVTDLQNKACSFKGPFSRAVFYERNSPILFRGLLWIAAADTQNETPSEGSNSWVLANKYDAQSLKQI